MPPTHRVILASEAFKLLRGLTVVYKPYEMPMPTLTKMLRSNLLEDLNSMERLNSPIPNQSLSKLIGQGPRSKKLVSVNSNELMDYSNHPLVVGDPYCESNLPTYHVNELTTRMSGLVLLSLRDVKLKHHLVNAKMMRTYEIKFEFGKLTDNGFIDGRVLQKSTYTKLKKAHVDKAMAAIQSSHQKAAFRLSGLDLRSQAAYKLAAKGPIRPVRPTEGLIYKLICTDFKPPEVTIEMTCIDETEEFIAELIAEFGFRLKTNATCSHIRCIRYGFFSLSHALLPKHINLENVTLNILETDKILRDNRDLIGTSPHFQRVNSNS